MAGARWSSLGAMERARVQLYMCHDGQEGERVFDFHRLEKMGNGNLGFEVFFFPKSF